VTISIGIATVIPDRSDSHLDLVHHSDMALYRAKAEGRDRAVHAARLLEIAAENDIHLSHH